MLSQRTREQHYQTLGTSVTNSQLSPSSLDLDKTALLLNLNTDFFIAQKEREFITLVPKVL